MKPRYIDNSHINKPVLQLAKILVQPTSADEVSFCNSGAKADGAAFKPVWECTHDKFGGEESKIIAFSRIFHGRTPFTVSVDGQSEYSSDHAPLPQGTTHLPYNDIEVVITVISSRTCAVIVESIVGESGVILADPVFPQVPRTLCDRHHVTSILDKVQTRAGRTGHLYAYQYYNVVPDILTSVKRLGGDFSIGAMSIKKAWIQVLQPGTHDTTFGDNPLVATVADVALAHLGASLPAGVDERHVPIVDQLNAISARYDAFSVVRGTGLLVGAKLAGLPHGKVKMLTNLVAEEGLIVLIAGPDVLCFVPVLNIPLMDIAEVFACLDRTVARLTRRSGGRPVMLFRPVRGSGLDGAARPAARAGVGMTSLPHGAERLAVRVRYSIEAFVGELPRGQQGFLSILEDITPAWMVGMSAARVAVGLDESFYNFYIQKTVRAPRAPGAHRSQELLSLSHDRTERSELYVLFLDPAYQHDCNDLLPSKACFLLIVTFREWFSPYSFAGLRGCSDEQGQSSFWDALGHHFFDVPFVDADRPIGTSMKTFVAELIPAYPVYISLLPGAVHEVVGQVHLNTIPARVIFEKEGSSWRGSVDILDAGPVLEANTDQTRAVRDSQCLPTQRLMGALPTPTLVVNGQFDGFWALLVAHEGQALLDAAVPNTLQVSEADRVYTAVLNPRENKSWR